MPAERRLPLSFRTSHGTCECRNSRPFRQEKSDEPTPPIELRLSQLRRLWVALHDGEPARGHVGRQARVLVLVEDALQLGDVAAKDLLDLQQAPRAGRRTCSGADARSTVD
eukprot:998520-Prymnesium_polylepis.1